MPVSKEILVRVEALSKSTATVRAALLVVGVCAAAFDVLQQTLIQMAVPDNQRGRAVGIWVLSIGSAPLGHLEMGLLIALLGVLYAIELAVEQQRPERPVGHALQAPIQQAHQPFPS